MIGRLAFFGAITLVLAAQQKPQDIDGWDKIRWGMTMGEVRSIYRVTAQPETADDWTLLQLQPVNFGGVQMGVQVGARRQNGKVVSVRLWSYFGSPDTRPTASARDFDTLRASLIERFGQPTSQDVTKGENGRLVKTMLWKFPSTSILLTLEQSASLPNLGKIFLEYTEPGN
jgi:hypothetical protein